ncbi:MAG: UDP-N-acetylmuramate:L-alanyl-gamma-D-glutamyl-meso-diaminopimelate ligase [gamma proteobacterium symbiont of Ctena orbiculata]|uniref:UDP-N-acetylmuramate--L-alanyl-gamma-D-glutamyl-meso-2,6-diaminoheptandioate ligase n=1 Tax=Candidatus Thiodiazotropha taylori TaxID=2792791 RepID=A0A944MA30_9GAMM|nr:UDP-N-acetylmuramate:L-alanyl-gamma-D-glutamyl-meso-diaminopimelate ligase [Candidatus Thiodiazotropha taylori]PUB84085.1 MAG: UDP-N-acetylmuramate:L-alanyl-gamma-D-glutamyl-meso-diaminopimelate ligase [gamma proteobacterium symbiont of Ctena orbiculata]MBT2988974.1 UDP-N-acetylmuramate:L-alanyl-gamma-D-glutamyl-meso-diaminopimelate ligase [Candidatus Thiodiazotropha taylori]MBT2996380.1 UDP-N-acetylmuramate:L-alanyl-gamma-D-glutamyl-meso-diaminopimelate ligase [Candidatus Thiodiazotropha tay
MHLHILGICGTFMGGIALLARALGHRVSGSDANVYPPMSTQLEEAGIEVMEGFGANHLHPAPDVVVVGNAMSRGNPAVEAMLNRGLPYTSGPQWLAENVLQGRWVLAVAGTHGKTSTASLLAWILEQAGLQPGFLIGGVPENFGVSARLGETPFFVVEADEYDTAFFDKRSKFVHYRPRTLILNNLEFDHADIFDDLAMIQRQFHHLLRTVPAEGLIITPLNDGNLSEVLDMGVWTPLEFFDPEIEAGWHAEQAAPDGHSFDVICEGESQGRVSWDLIGRHNVANALAAIAAARHAGVAPSHAIGFLGSYKNVKRRLELRGEVNGVRVYDDFAHHPTAIETTLEGLRRRVGDERIFVLLEPRSNTMKRGVHADRLADALQDADRVMMFMPDDLGWDAEDALAPLGDRFELFVDTASMVSRTLEQARPGDHFLVMSNGGFEAIHQRLLDALQSRL